MPPLEPLLAPLGELLGDPLVGYPAAAAALLFLVSLAGGATRGDARVLARPRAWVTLGVAVLASFALTAGNEQLAGAWAEEWWPLDGVRRLPLYLVALGYGPAPGALAAVLFLAAEATLAPIPGGELVLLLETSVVGWLALAPSPFRHRWAAPLDAVLGWALAWATAGTALLASLHLPLEPVAFREAIGASIGGVTVTALILMLLPPRTWHALFPDSRISPEDTGDDGPRTIEPLDARRPRRPLHQDRWPEPEPWPRERPPRRKG